MKAKLFFLLLISLSLLPQTTLGGTISYQYDVYGRVKAVSYSDGRNAAYAYDPVDNRKNKATDVALIAGYDDADDSVSGWGPYDVGWDIYDNDPAGASISYVVDAARGSRVIAFAGSGTANGYRLRNSDGSWWDNRVHDTMQWSMNYAESFVVYIPVQTTQGFRFIYYTPVDYDSLGDDSYIHHGLGSAVTDGSWRTFTRDLEHDLQDAQPGNDLEAVLGFYIRGTGRVDDIRTLKDFPADIDSDSDGITDVLERNTYGSNPYLADTDADGISDGDELVYWGSDWNGDIDGDGIINLLDADADNDGIYDGTELEQGTDPADTNSVSASITYEDAEDGNVSGWDVYDDDPSGASISNVDDAAQASRVIELSGSAINNGYRLRNADGSWWNNGAHQHLQWSMNYAENFTIYIATMTTDGFRYLYFTAAEQDYLGDETYIHHGLGAAAKDGSWRTITRDLEFDLQQAQPGNHLEAILGVFVRGSGRVDDIQTLRDYPADLDTDSDGITDVLERGTYGSNPYLADTDADGISDGDELAHWGSDWNGDIDGDGSINLLDADADNDGIYDGAELEQGTDPADANSVSPSITYEDAEGGDVSGWDVYDDDPSGASITNLDDAAHGSRVIALSGSAINNGYRLRNADGSWWNNGAHQHMQWSMNYAENFTIYIAAMTTDGFRYIFYTAAGNDNLGDATYVHHGLGSGARDGSWQTFTRDLEADLQAAQPGNNLEAILGFLVRGSGRVDAIKTLE